MAVATSQLQICQPGTPQCTQPVQPTAPLISPVNDDSQNSKAEVQHNGYFRQIMVVAHGQGCQHYALERVEEPGEEDEAQEGQRHSRPQGLHQLLGLFKGFAPLLACSECAIIIITSIWQQ